MGFTCKIFGHKWNGCKCERCGTTRDEGHNWVIVEGKCIEKCSVCGKERNIEHKWNGCKCERCGNVRNEYDRHNWVIVEGKCVKVCSICGREDFQYNAHHSLQAVPNKCQEKCTICGFTKDIEHQWANGICVRCGADINKGNSKISTPPLIWEVLEGNLEKVQTLLKGGAKVDVFYEETPLMAAARKGYDEKHIEIVKLLLAHGANVNATDIYGSSALRLAQRKGLTKMVELLASYGGKYLGA